jgi:hypothetical protein
MVLFTVTVRRAPRARACAAANPHHLAQSAASRVLVYDGKLQGLRGTAKAGVWEWDSWEWTHVMVYRLEQRHLVILHTEVLATRATHDHPDHPACPRLHPPVLAGTHEPGVLRGRGGLLGQAVAYAAECSMGS